MPFTVAWLPSALNELAAIWNQAADRQAVTEAANRIEQVLRFNPDSKGRPTNGYRVYADPPLAFLYHVSPDDRVVTIVSVTRR